MPEMIISPRRRAVTLIEVLVVISIVGLLIGLTTSAVQRVRASAKRTQCQNNVRQLALALHSYHGVHSRLPSGMTYRDGKDPQPFLSWLARVLPHLEQDALWSDTESSFRQNPDFLSPGHAARAVVVTNFLCPSDTRLTTPSSKDVTGHFVAYTSYSGVVGRNSGLNDGLLYVDSQHRLSDAADGTSNTLLIGERPPNSDLTLGWWYAGWGQAKNGDAEFLLGVRSRCYNRYIVQCPEGPYTFTPGDFKNPCDAFHFWSPHPGGANFAFADGSVRFLTYSADSIMPALATRAGGEVVDIP